MIKLDTEQKARIFTGYKALRKERRDHQEAIKILKQSDFSHLSRNDLKQIIKAGKRTEHRA